MISKAIKTIKHTNYKGEDDSYNVVCALEAWKAIEPEVGGTWRVIREHIDDTEKSKRRCSVLVERSDRLRLWINGASNRYGDKPNTITVSVGYYEDAQGHRLDLSYTEPRGVIGSTTLDVTKRTAKTLAKLIATKIITPLEAKLPAICKRLDDSAKAQSSFAATCQAFRDAGGTCRERDTSSAYATLCDVSFTVGHGGSVRIESTYMSFEQAKKVAAILGKK